MRAPRYDEVFYAGLDAMDAMDAREDGGVMEQVVCRVVRVRPGAELPLYKSDTASGMDLAASFEGGSDRSLPTKGVIIGTGRIVTVGTGIAIEIPYGYEGQVRPRSGLASKSGLTVINAPGTIDSDYRGEIKVPLINLGQVRVIITPGMRIAQLVIAPVAHVSIQVVESLTRTDRGSNGFGSTGV